MDAGYIEAPFGGPSDVVLVNTCTVTAEADRKSRQMIRRAVRQNPDASVIVCGCLAQRSPESLLESGARLILGAWRRAEAVELLEQAAASGGPMIAVEGDIGKAYEPLSIRAGTEGRVRATIKVQEGCDARCAYCIVPDVRGPARSRPLDDIAREAEKLQGYLELTLTGINLSAYGCDLPAVHGAPVTLADAVRTVSSASSVPRIRLGSLEPTLVTPEFIERLLNINALCPHFPIALQSGCDETLGRMRRPYTTAQYVHAIAAVRDAYPGAAITTDILVGFPGETDAEFRRTAEFVREISFSRVHVFPYSPRENTAAAAMPGQLPEAVKRGRARELIKLGRELEREFISGMIGRSSSVLFEQDCLLGAEGYSGEYVRVRADGAVPGLLANVCLTDFSGEYARGVLS